MTTLTNHGRYEMKHKHAEIMMEYAKDAMETDRPWERWQTELGSNPTWVDCVYHPTWHPNTEYRRKPKTIIVNGIEVPAPETDKPKCGTEYYFPSFTKEIGVDWFRWTDEAVDNRILNSGLLYLNRKDAIARKKAMLND